MEKLGLRFPDILSNRILFCDKIDSNKVWTGEPVRTVLNFLGFKNLVRKFGTQ